MERNERTTVGELQPGDRFYKLSDTKKTVMIKVEYAIKKTFFQTYNQFAITETDKRPQPLKKDTKVVFLRRGEVITVA